MELGLAASESHCSRRANSPRVRIHASGVYGASFPRFASLILLRPSIVFRSVRVRSRGLSPFVREERAARRVQRPSSVRNRFAQSSISRGRGRVRDEFLSYRSRFIYELAARRAEVIYVRTFLYTRRRSTSRRYAALWRTFSRVRPARL